MKKCYELFEFNPKIPAQQGFLGPSLGSTFLKCPSDGYFSTIMSLGWLFFDHHPYIQVAISRPLPPIVFTDTCAHL